MLRTPQSLAAAALVPVILALASCGGAPEKQPTFLDTPSLAQQRAWKTWTRANAFRIAPPESSTAFDFAFLAPVLQDRGLVMLGDHVAGTAESPTTRLRAVRYLHEQLGFDVLALEYGLYDGWRADRDTAATSRNVLEYVVQSRERTAELEAVLAYAQATRRTAHPLHLAGFGLETQSRLAGPGGRAAFLRRLITRVDSTYAREVEALARQAERGDAATKEQAKELVAELDRAARFVRQHEADLAPGEVISARIAERSLWSSARLLHLERELGRDAPHFLEERDRVLASNLMFVLDEMFPDRKCIVWSHNRQIRRDGDHVLPAPFKNLGRELARTRGDRIYTIGVFPGGGRTLGPDGKANDVPPPKEGSLESVFAATGFPLAFLDLSRAPRESGSAWITRSLEAADDSAGVERFVPFEQYDGLLFFANATPARPRP